MKTVIGQVIIRTNKRQNRALIIRPGLHRILVSHPDALNLAVELITGIKVRSVQQGPAMSIFSRSLEVTAV